MTVREFLETLLDRIETTKYVEGSAIGSRDGLIICSKCQKEYHAETVVAMSAFLHNAAETALSGIGKKIPERVIIESVKGKIITMGAGEKAILIVITKPDVYLESVLNEMEIASEKIKKVL
jgi:predicted regulator of Ras-like GTPase activity (Roadblock/LC7/MglB family)